MEFTKQYNVEFSQLPKDEARVESSYKQCLLSSVWSQSRVVASLLDQAGITYHRVFGSQALELFLLMINTELTVCYHLDNFSPSSISSLNRDLLHVQSALISSMDTFVLETLKQQHAQKTQHNLFNRMIGKHKQWESSAKSRFEQVICSVLEQKVVKKVSERESI